MTTLPEDSRPQPPPNLTPTIARTLFSTRISLLPTHPLVRRSREWLLGDMPAALRRLEKAARLYHDESPKTRVGEAHEWAECLSAVEALERLCAAVRATLQEEEGE